MGLIGACVTNEETVYHSDDNLVKKGKYNREKLASAYGYESNKDVKFKHITGLHIQKFRSLENRDVKLGKQLTLITGKMVL